MQDIQMQHMNMIKNQRKRSSIQNGTDANEKLEEAGLSSNQEGSRGVGLILGANLKKHHPKTQSSKMTKIPIEGPRWIPIK